MWNAPPPAWDACSCQKAFGAAKSPKSSQPYGSRFSFTSGRLVLTMRFWARSVASSTTSTSLRLRCRVGLTPVVMLPFGCPAGP